MEYLEVQGKIGPSQHGFVKGRSCLTNLLEFFEEISVKRKEVIGTIGSSVFLDPEHQGDLSRSATLWTFTVNNKSPVTIVDYVPNQPVEEPNEQFRSRLWFNASSGWLLVRILKPEDQGIFSFVIDERKTSIIELFLYYKLSEIVIRSNRAPGYIIQLTCDVAGNPHKYEWQKNGGEVSEDHWLIYGNRSLVIPTNECGTYTCIATNPVSSDQANYTVTLPGISGADSIIIIASITGLVSSLVPLSGFLLLSWLEKKSKQASQSLIICSILSFVATFITLISWIAIKDAAFVPAVALGTVSALLLVIIAPIVIPKLGCSFKGKFQGKKGSQPFVFLSGFIIIPITIVILKEEIQQNNQSCHTSILTWSIPIALLASCVIIVSVFLATYRYRNEDTSIEIKQQGNEDL
ncbi:uncharacterized protein LOC127585861 isoform X1 [Pristis pectinata]|uniref:uncharacterized protein LOC127585861 isoform X1 n=1 Tax=Pristis pectinata TaxID=685728 RepID=UPI00223D1749|nr:uncharacterized protein LOC127585861 isoform X1 [Pristis pectinata]